VNPVRIGTKWFLENAMREYKKILAAIDVTEGSEKILERARDVAARYGAQVILLHVVEYVPVEPMGEALLPAVQIEGELVERATRRIAELAARTGLDQAERLVHAGNIKAELVRVAQDRAVDLIVLGSRERHGLSIMFNQTEDTILHTAPCDVLAVRWNRT
jgi:universal stress protein A